MELQTKKKSLIGLKPRHIHEIGRMGEVICAMAGYVEKNGMSGLPIAWIEEMVELHHRCAEHYARFDKDCAELLHAEWNAK